MLVSGRKHTPLSFEDQIYKAPILCTSTYNKKRKIKRNYGLITYFLDLFKGLISPNMVIVNKMAASIVEVMKSPKASGTGRPDFRSIAQTRSRKHANGDTPYYVH